MERYIMETSIIRYLKNNSPGEPPLYDTLIAQPPTLSALLACAFRVEAQKPDLLQQVRDQANKDIKRGNYHIDGVSTANNVPQTMAMLTEKISSPNDYNIVLLLLCQNVRNLLNDVIQMKLASEAGGAAAPIITKNKSVCYIVTAPRLTVTIKSSAVIVDAANVEIVRGQLSYTFVANVADNTMRFDGRLPAAPGASSTANSMVPIALGVAGLIAAPFLLGGKYMTAVPGMQYPTQKGMLGANPRDSAIASMNNNSAAQARANASLAGGAISGAPLPYIARGRLNRKFNSSRRRRGRGRGGAVTVPQYNMLYEPQGGPGTNPNNQIQANSQTSTQQAANSVYDKNATAGGAKRHTRRRSRHRRKQKRRGTRSNRYNKG
jgi:hypothetical protein